MAFLHRPGLAECSDRSGAAVAYVALCVCAPNGVCGAPKSICGVLRATHAAGLPVGSGGGCCDVRRLRRRFPC